MTERMFRVQILLEPELHKVLAEIAERENHSISDVVHGILRDYLISRQETHRLEREVEALERLRQIREEGRKRYGVYHGGLIAEAREERDQDIEQTWRGES